MNGRKERPAATIISLKEGRIMHRAIAIIAVVAVSLVAAGCSGTQKATAAGAGVGAATGATVAHYATSASGGVGALVGAGIGAAGGEIAEDHSLVI